MRGKDSVRRTDIQISILKSVGAEIDVIITDSAGAEESRER